MLYNKKYTAKVEQTKNCEERKKPELVALVLVIIYHSIANVG